MGRPHKRSKHDSPPQAPTRPILDPTSEIVTVRLGTGVSKVFQIHYNILTSTSEFFKNVVKQACFPPGRLTIDLARFEVDTFRCYAVWLYHRQLIFSDCEDNVSQWWEVVTSAYVMGEELLDVTFKNAVMDRMMTRVMHLFVVPIQEWVPQEPTVSAIRKVYGGTTETSKARQLFVEVTAEAISMDKWEASKDELPVDFITDLTTFMLARRGVGHCQARLKEDPNFYLEWEGSDEKRL